MKIVRRASKRVIIRDKCSSLLHPLIHRSRTSHRCNCGYRTVWDLVARGECPECDEVRLESEIQDLLADLDVLTDFDDRIRRHPELVAKIARVVEPKDLEKLIKAVAAAVREDLGLKR